MIPDAATPQLVELPPPSAGHVLPLHDAFRARRSEREFAGDALSLDSISNLLWAAQGITHREGLRTAASAGALYPLEVSVAAGNVQGLAPGLYRFRPQGHVLERRGSHDLRSDLCSLSGGQDCVGNAAAIVVFSAVVERTTSKYGNRGIRYALIEVGLAAQGMGLMAVGLGLGSVMVGSFDDERVCALLNLPSGCQPIAMMCVGKSRRVSRGR